MGNMDGIINRMRERLGDQDYAEYADNSPLVAAAAMFIEDTYGPSVTGIEYAIDQEAETIDPPITGAQLLLVSLGAAIRLLEGVLARESRDVISMDSPAGRINTNERPAAIRSLLGALKSDYRAEILRTSPVGIEWVDTSIIATGRLDGTETGTEQGAGGV